MFSARTKWRGIVCAAVGFVAMALWVEVGSVVFDQTVLTGFEAMRSPALNDVVLALTALGHGRFIVPATAVLILLLVRRSRRSAMFVVISVGGDACLNVFAKYVFSRPRPDVLQRVYEPTGWSFPSGHAMASLAFFLTLYLIVARYAPRHRRWVAVAGAAMVVLIGMSRCYLGVHYPTDVGAGWCLGTVWVLGSALWHDRGIHAGPN